MSRLGRRHGPTQPTDQSGELKPGSILNRSGEIPNFASRAWATDMGQHNLLRFPSGDLNPDQILILAWGMTHFERRVWATDIG